MGKFAKFITKINVIIQRSQIDKEFSGPAIILESTAVTYVDKNYIVNKDKMDHLIITDTKMKNE